MDMTIKYVYGDTLDTSYFVASDAQGNEKVARATSVIPRGLHALASANKLQLEPEDFIAELQKHCSDLNGFENFTTKLAANSEELEVKAATKGDGPTFATEPQDVQKTPDKPIVAAEEGLTQEPKGSEPAPDTKALLGGLPAKVRGETEQAVDVNSSAVSTDPKDTQITALAEEVKEKGEKVKELEGKLGDKEKEEKLSGVVKALQKLNVDAAEVDKLKKELLNQPEPVIGLIERVLKACSPPAEGVPPKGKAPAAAPKGAPGMPEGMAPPFEKKAASSDSLDLSASNLPAAPLAEGPPATITEKLTGAWLGADRERELRAEVARA
jgi:hypothetical protein